MRELRVLVSPRVHVHRLAQESAWVDYGGRALGDSGEHSVSDMCELSVLVRTWLLATTTTRTASTRTALLLLLFLGTLLLWLLGALLLLAEGRVRTLALNRT